MWLIEETDLVLEGEASSRRKDYEAQPILTRDSGWSNSVCSLKSDGISLERTPMPFRTGGMKGDIEVKTLYI